MPVSEISLMAARSFCLTQKRRRAGERDAEMSGRAQIRHGKTEKERKKR